MKILRQTVEGMSELEDGRKGKREEEMKRGKSDVQTKVTLKREMVFQGQSDGLVMGLLAYPGYGIQMVFLFVFMILKIHISVYKGNGSLDGL